MKSKQHNEIKTTQLEWNYIFRMKSKQQLEWNQKFTIKLEFWNEIKTAQLQWNQNSTITMKSKQHNYKNVQWKNKFTMKSKPHNCNEITHLQWNENNYTTNTHNYFNHNELIYIYREIIYTGSKMNDEVIENAYKSSATLIESSI